MGVWGRESSGISRHIRPCLHRLPVVLHTVQAARGGGPTAMISAFLEAMCSLPRSSFTRLKSRALPQFGQQKTIIPGPKQVVDSFNSIAAPQ